MKARARWLLLLGFASATALAGDAARSGEAGRPVVRNFSPRDYEAHNQVFTLAEAANGLMYFGVYGHVLEFDGRTWRKIPVPTSWIRGLVAMPDGAVYVAATDELGVCREDAQGLRSFTSLLPKLPAALRPTGPVWSAVAHEHAVWFSASGFVARFKGGELRHWSFPPASRATLHLAGGELLLRRVGDALYRWSGEEFVRIATEPELIAPSVVSWIDDGPGGALALTERGQFFRLRAGQLARWTPAVAAETAKSGVRMLARCRDGALAIATLSSGVLLAEADGTLRDRITEATSGLISDVTYALHEDRSGGLWVATFAGVSRLELGGGLTVFDSRNGRGATITYDMVRRGGRLHVGSTDSLYRLEPASPEHPARLERLRGQSIWSSNLELHGDDLLLTDGNGVLRFRGDAPAERIVTTPASAAELARSVTDPARYFLSSVEGLQTFSFDGDRVVAEGLIAGFSGDTQSFLEEPDGTLWIGTIQRGYVRARRRAGRSTWQDAELVNFAPGTRGLPADPGWCRVVPGVDGAPLFSTGRGAFVPDATREQLVPAPPFVAAGKAGLYSHPLLVADQNTIYAQIGSADALDQLTLGRLVRRDGQWTWQTLPKAATETAGYLGAYHLHFERDAAGGEGVLWVSGREGLVRLDLGTALAAPPASPVAQIRAVSQRDVGRWGAALGSARQPLHFAFSREPIEFTFAAPRYDAAAKLNYQTRLQGYADAWSEWSPRGEVSFTNLSGGPFVFEVRARDADGRTGPVARFSFSVAPPWHRSGFAVGLYVVALGGAVLGFVRWRLRAAEHERARLEKLVTLRTEELRLAKNAADDANRAKSVFLANMSHELRTPLNGVIGYAQVLMKDRELSPKNRDRVQVMQNSGEHLLRMINEVLDFSKIEANKMELTTTAFHLPQLLRDIAAAISARVEQKQLEFIFEPAAHLPDLVLGDPLKLRQVIDNLIGNAVKFTPRGSIRFEARMSDAENEQVTFVVSDTGVGISAADRATLFQPFQQAVDGRPPEPGTGLGLAISQRMVELMGGRLEVESTPGAGSTFSFAVRLPVLAVDATAAPAAAARITGYRGRRRRVLVVDDVATNRAVLRELLAPLGFVVSEAASGVEALGIVANVRPDVVLLDLRMPGIDGFELARRLRAPANDAPIKLIAMSASVLSFSREDAFAAGCDDFLPKPFREDDLLARLGLALQLEWLGEGGETMPAAAPVSVAAATSLPASILEELLACARRGEIGALRRVLAAHAGDPLAGTLEGLARRFRMEQIRTLLENQLAAPPSPPSPPSAPQKSSATP